MEEVDGRWMREVCDEMTSDVWGNVVQLYHRAWSVGYWPLHIVFGFVSYAPSDGGVAYIADEEASIGFCPGYPLYHSTRSARLTC